METFKEKINHSSRGLWRAVGSLIAVSGLSSLSTLAFLSSWFLRYIALLNRILLRTKVFSRLSLSKASSRDLGNILLDIAFIWYIMKDYDNFVK
jgi:hypothetical protein